jgi:hypothetical protein
VVSILMTVLALLYTTIIASAIRISRTRRGTGGCVDVSEVSKMAM